MICVLRIRPKVNERQTIALSEPIAEGLRRGKFKLNSECFENVLDIRNLGGAPFVSKPSLCYYTG